jgi:hypothetical protein
MFLKLLIHKNLIDSKIKIMLKDMNFFFSLII